MGFKMKFSSSALLIACMQSKSAFARLRNLRDAPVVRGGNFVAEPESLVVEPESLVVEPEFILDEEDGWGPVMMDFFAPFGELNFFGDESTQGEEGFFGGLPGSFSSTFQSFSQNADGGFDSYTVENRSGVDGEEPKTVKIEEHGVMGEGGEIEDTKTTTKIYADGHSTEDVEHKTLEKDAPFEEIFGAYKGVFDEMTPLAKILENRIGLPLNDAVNHFMEEAKGVDEEEILQSCNMSRDKLIEDFDDFKESYEELDELEDIQNDPETAEKVDKLTNNFAQLVSFKL